MAYIVDDFSDELERLDSLVGERLLSDWEEEFIMNLRRKNADASLSAKQVMVINDLLDKVNEKGWLTKGWGQ